MANSTKVISQGNENKHASRVIKAFDALNLEDFSEKPNGVWGSTATIKSNGVTVKSSELDLEFDVPFDDDLESDEGEVIIYNLSDGTIKELKAKEGISIEAGYEGDTGVLFQGYIRKVSTAKSGADKITTIKVISDIENKKSANISKNSVTKASDLLLELLELTNMPIAKFEVESDYTYEDNITIDEPLEAAIKTQSEVCGVSTFVSNGAIYCCKLENARTDLEFNVSEDTGMIGSPSPFEETTKTGNEEKVLEGFEIEMLLQHRAAVGAIVNLTSENYKGKYHVKSGRHTFNESEAKTTIKVV